MYASKSGPDNQSKKLVVVASTSSQICEGGDCWSYPTTVVEEAGEGIYKKLAFDEEICSRPPPNENSMQAIYTKSFIQTLDP